MNWDQIEGKWTEYVGKAKQQWGKFTNDELEQIEGRRDELVGAIQEKYGKSKAEAEKEIDDWATRH